MCDLIYTEPDGYVTPCKGVITSFRTVDNTLYNACSFHINLYKTIEVLLGMGYDLEILETLNLAQITKLYAEIPTYYKRGYFQYATKKRK